VTSQINDISTNAYSGVAMSMALAANYMPPLAAGEAALGVGMGAYQGYGALGVTYKRVSEDGRKAWGFGLATTGNNYGVNAGFSWKWQ